MADPANVEAGLPQGKSSAVLSEEFAILAWPVLQLTGLLQDVRGRICQRRSPRRASLCFVRPLAPALQSASKLVTLSPWSAQHSAHQRHSLPARFGGGSGKHRAYTVGQMIADWLSKSICPTYHLSLSHKLGPEWSQVGHEAALSVCVQWSKLTAQFALQQRRVCTRHSSRIDQSETGTSSGMWKVQARRSWISTACARAPGMASMPTQRRGQRGARTLPGEPVNQFNDSR